MTCKSNHTCKSNLYVWHAQSEAWAWELRQMFLATHHALRKLRDVPRDVGLLHDVGNLANNFTLWHDVGDHFALDVSQSKVSSGPAIG